jgi:hypothetical protein
LTVEEVIAYIQAHGSLHHTTDLPFRCCYDCSNVLCTTDITLDHDTLSSGGLAVFNQVACPRPSEEGEASGSAVQHPTCEGASQTSQATNHDITLVSVETCLVLASLNSNFRKRISMLIATLPILLREEKDCNASVAS